MVERLNNKTIHIEVAYALPNKQCVLALSLIEGCTIKAALIHSEISHLFPEINMVEPIVGIWGQQKLLTTVLREGDRIEIYRPLLCNPKEARRMRARKKHK